MKNPFIKSISPQPIDAPEEHRISMPGLEIAFNNTLKTVFMIDMTGSKDMNTLRDLEEWCRAKGWFLHCISVEPAPNRLEVPPKKKPNG